MTSPLAAAAAAEDRRAPHAPAARTHAEPVLEVEGLRAYYQTRYFGVVREVRAVDDISLRVMPNQI